MRDSYQKGATLKVIFEFQKGISVKVVETKEILPGRSLVRLWSRMLKLNTKFRVCQHFGLNSGLLQGHG